ncbi:hypothetical protein [Shewanella aestuarii]|uniref:Uncharacterized protein n=1 Tax=Shewanella aestuarii TaxID=1028752 RepID=A0A6G9QPV7_9GAMM|nr:hypothetical protein [Shewanella aestuarii]QIR16624.1 hypothetical protein HBH39_19300 [Shewanella aestuarii]
MEFKKFKAYMLTAEKMSCDYSRGYKHGLRRCYHGESFGTEQEHDQYMQMGITDEYRKEIGDGYRDGFAGKAPKNRHGNIGNTNAQKELPADTQLQCRINSQFKAQIIRQANKDGMKLTPWILQTLAKACDEDTK